MPILRKVLTSFDYAYDGVRPNRLRPGRSYRFQPEDAARFEGEGKLEPLAATPKPSTVRAAKRHKAGGKAK